MDVVFHILFQLVMSLSVDSLVYGLPCPHRTVVIEPHIAVLLIFGLQILRENAKELYFLLVCQIEHLFFDAVAHAFVAVDEVAVRFGFEQIVCHAYYEFHYEPVLVVVKAAVVEHYVLLQRVVMHTESCMSKSGIEVVA